MSSSSHPSSPQPGTVLAGRYRLEEIRAHGGMADVWRATDLQLGRIVAVKLLKPHLANESTLSQRFRREAIAAAKLDHSSIVTVHDAIEDDGRLAVIMAFIDGRSLREELDHDQTLSVSKVLHIGLYVLAALNAAHQQDLIHRDVKPGNILISKRNEVLLTDFGIAKILDGDDDLTSENIMMGTAKYLSPEQVRGDQLDGRADLYSLGLVLYECLAGKVPFVGKNDTDTALARLHRDPTDLSTLRPDVDPVVTTIIHKLLAREPEDRYANAREAGEAIQKVINVRKSQPATGAPRTERDRTPTPGKVIRPKNHTPTGTIRTPTPSNPTQLPKDERPTPPPSQQKKWRPPPLLIGGAVVSLLLALLIIPQILDSGDPKVVAPDTTLANVVTNTDPIKITGVQSFDPQGDDGEENPTLLANITDGDLSSAWSTDCYQSSTFGSKSGVGVVVQISASAMAQLQIGILGRDWKAEVYAANTNSDDLALWGSPIWEGTDESGSTISATFGTPSQYVLVYLRKVGASGFCSNKNPYRGDISEISIVDVP